MSINLRLGIKIDNRKGGAAYPPILDDGNTVAWFDYLKNITKDGSDNVSEWGTRTGISGSLLQATGTNQPIVNANGVLFDGVDNFMKCAAFTLAQPEMIFIVFKQVTWVASDIIFDGNLFNYMHFRQYATTGTPNLNLYAGTLLASNGNLPLNTYGIARCLFNGASSKLIINNTTPLTGDVGARDGGGFTLGAGPSPAQFSNIEVKEIIVRKIADTSGNESDIYDYLSNKYSI